GNASPFLDDSPRLESLGRSTGLTWQSPKITEVDLRLGLHAGLTGVEPTVLSRGSAVQAVTDDTPLVAQLPRSDQPRKSTQNGGCLAGLAWMGAGVGDVSSAARGGDWGGAEAG